MTFRRLLSASSLFAFLLVAYMLRAQQAQPSRLDDILQRLESNLLYYHSVVPSFFCDEHASSRVDYNDVRTDGTVTESAFRLRRVLNADNKTVLEESREIKTVNGHPSAGDRVSGPAIVAGAFSGGLSVVSLSQKACMRYTLLPTKSGYSHEPYIVEFASVPVGELPSNCVLREDGSGRVFIDPNTLQILRLELHAPHHIIIPARRMADGHVVTPTVGVWDLSIKYAPVALDGKTFWMPSTIDSTSTADATVWLFNASYRNYHKLEVTSRILP